MVGTAVDGVDQRAARNMKKAPAEAGAEEIQCAQKGALPDLS